MVYILYAIYDIYIYIWYIYMIYIWYIYDVYIYIWYRYDVYIYMIYIYTVYYIYDIYTVLYICYIYIYTLYIIYMIYIYCILCIYYMIYKLNVHSPRSTIAWGGPTHHGLQQRISAVRTAALDAPSPAGGPRWDFWGLGNGVKPLKIYPNIPSTRWCPIVS